MATRFQPLAQRLYDRSGKPLNGASVYFYDAGTYSARATYSDAALKKSNPNPVKLNASGYMEHDVFLDEGSYRVIVVTVDGIREWDMDNVESEIIGNLGAQIGTVWFFYGNATELAALTDVGWYVCDGTNGTPDMLKRFVYGTNSVKDAGLSGGNSGVDSSATVTISASAGGHSLTLDEMPAHIHSSSKATVPNAPVAMGDNSETGEDFSIEYPNHTEVNTVATVGSGSAHSHAITADAINVEPTYKGLIPIIYLGT